MTDQERKVMEMALDALEWSWGGEPLGTKEFEAITAIRQALAQPDTAPPSKSWVSLTDEDMCEAFTLGDSYADYARAIEAALRSKNNG